MIFSGILPVLSAVLAIGQVSPSVAEPIPAEVRAYSLRALQDGAVVESIPKRALPDDLFGSDGRGARYWAWAKLAYDDEYNNQPGKELGDASGKAWEKLGGSKIFVKGYAGDKVAGTFGPTFTGMKAVVGKDDDKKVIVMSFIGTNDKPTTWQDGKFVHVTDSSGAIAGQLTKGFYECYSSVQQQAFEWTKQYADENPDWDIVITGHSLGGATAQIAAAGWAAAQGDHAKRTTLITYGAPRAGDLEFHQALSSSQGDRMNNFQHEHDLVPHLPLMRVPGAQYANAGHRYVFRPNGDSPSWFDANLWEHFASPDQEGDIRGSLVAVVKDLKDNFAQHKAYFSSTTIPGRSIGLVEDGMSSISKREIPSERDYQIADGLIDQIMQSNELSGEPELTPKLEQLTSALKVSSEQSALLEALRSYDNEGDRIEFLEILKIAAMEQKE